MARTRQEILREIGDWAISPSNHQTLLWLHGPAGSGKSSIAASLADHLHHRKHLAASFFCKQNSSVPSLSDPCCVMSSLIHQFAMFCKPFGKLVVQALQNDRDLANAPVDLQFDDLLVKPLQQLSESYFMAPSCPFVMVIDGLDQCGDDDTRQLLLLCIQKMSGLVDWLKIIVTSRPNIESSFMRPLMHYIREYDLSDKDALDDIIIYTEHCMGDVAQKHNLDAGWPGTEKQLALAQKANGIFAWTKAMSDFISNTLDHPAHRLNLVLAGASVNYAT